MFVGVSCVCVWTNVYDVFVIRVIFLASKDKDTVLKSLPGPVQPHWPSGLVGPVSVYCDWPNEIV